MGDGYYESALLRLRRVTGYLSMRYGDVVKKQNIELAMVAVPKTEAQSVADLLIKAGLKVILNFAPVNLNAPAHVTIRNVNMAIELEALSYRLVAEENPQFSGGEPKLATI